jgi:L-amino acid N-acyltransferase YncA
MIRKATTEDAEQISNIYNYYVENTYISFDEEPKSVDVFIDMINSGNPWLVYKEDAQIIGFAYTSPWKTKRAYRLTHESTIYFKHGTSGKGLGSKLYSQLISNAREQDLHSLVACIALPHDQSVKFHEKLGFTKTAHFEEVGFKQDTWLDVGYWQLKLQD